MAETSTWSHRSNARSVTAEDGVKDDTNTEVAEDEQDLLVAFDDEPFTARQRAKAEAAWQEYLRGDSTPLEEVRRQLRDEAEAQRSSVG